MYFHFIMANQRAILASFNEIHETVQKIKHAVEYVTMWETDGIRLNEYRELLNLFSKIIAEWQELAVERYNVKKMSSFIEKWGHLDRFKPILFFNYPTFVWEQPNEAQEVEIRSTRKNLCDQVWKELKRNTFYCGGIYEQ